MKNSLNYKLDKSKQKKLMKMKTQLDEIKLIKKTKQNENE